MGFVIHMLCTLLHILNYYNLSLKSDKTRWFVGFIESLGKLQKSFVSCST